MNTEKRIIDCTLQELQELSNIPVAHIAPFNSITIVPMKELHESGFKCMKFILQNNNEIVGIVSGWSDVLHINGIGGYGLNYRDTIRTQMVKRVGWHMDCLPGSGCVRLMADCECVLKDTWIGSDFEFFVKTGSK